MWSISTLCRLSVCPVYASLLIWMPACTQGAIGPIHVICVVVVCTMPNQAPSLSDLLHPSLWQLAIANTVVSATISVDHNPASALRSRFVAPNSIVAVSLQLCDATKQVNDGPIWRVNMSVILAFQMFSTR